MSPPSVPPAVARSSTAGDGPAKRRKLSPTARLTFTTRQMEDVGTSLEVDHMVLDYLLHQAIETCFLHPNTPPLSKELTAVGRSVALAHDFLRLFQHRYPRYRPDPPLRFRQQLLRLVTLATQRMVRSSVTPSAASLQTLRGRNQARAREWIRDASRLPTAPFDVAHFDAELPISGARLEANRARTLELVDIAAEDEAYDDAFFGTSACVSLLDLIPLFMGVTASCQRLWDGGSLSSQWMRLAAAWMLQACVEQYLIYGKDGSDAIDEAFAWGYQRKSRYEESADDPFDVEHEEEDAERWQAIRDRALRKLFPEKDKDGRRDSSLVWHLGAVGVSHPVRALQEDIWEFLKSLAEAVAPPVLAQLETGQLEGMSPEETRKFIKDCGLRVETFCDHQAPMDRMDTT